VTLRLARAGLGRHHDSDAPGPGPVSVTVQLQVPVTVTVVNLPVTVKLNRDLKADSKQGPSSCQFEVARRPAPPVRLESLGLGQSRSDTGGLALAVTAGPGPLPGRRVEPAWQSLSH
jgi:hypothetical protein